jgi:hypothetical protein
MDFNIPADFHIEGVIENPLTTIELEANYQQS